MGRTQELTQVMEILAKFGSAAIVQFGGVGKTQLMTAFAEKAERDGKIDGGTFWITADGTAARIVDSLANLWEKLLGTHIRPEERNKQIIVVDALKRGLAKLSGRWLLCLDNVDNALDSDVSGLLEAICRVSERSQRVDGC